MAADCSGSVRKVMELTKGEELKSIHGKESFLPSHNCPSTNDLHSVQWTSGVRMELDADKCNHFSIRGYVAEVRKRDAKLCWPLSVPQDLATRALADLLPPLAIPKFRHWSCLNCVQSITGDVMRDITEDMRENELNVKNSLVTANANQSSSDKDLGERVVGEYSSIIANHGENSHELPHTEKIAVKNVIEEGNQICRSDHLKSPENQGQSVNLATADGKSLQTEENLMRKGKRDRMIDIEISLELSNRTKECKEKCNGIRKNCKRKLTSKEAIQENSKIVSVVDMRTPNKDVVAMKDAFSHEQVDKDQISDIHLSVDLSGKQDNETEAGLVNRKPAHKKVRKKRSLEDILKNDESCISKKVKVSNGEAGFAEKKRKHELLCGSELKAQNSGSKDLGVNQSSQAQLTEAALNISTAYPGEEEPSPMNWLNELSKKAKTDTECTDINTSTQKGSEVKGLGKNMIKGQNDFSQANSQAPCLMLQSENMSSEDKLTKFIHPENAPLKVRFKFCKSNQSLGGLESSHHQKTNFSKENKRYLSNKGDTEKQKGTDILGTENEDDIPMDIVELLAKNQHERYQTTTKVASASNWMTPVVNENSKHEKSSIAGNCELLAKNQHERHQTTTKVASASNWMTPVVNENSKHEKSSIAGNCELLAKNQHERHQTTTKVASASNWTTPVVNENLKHEKSYTAGNCETDNWNTLNRSQHMINDAGQCLHNGTRNQDLRFGLEAVKLKEQQRHNLHIDLNKQATGFQMTPDCSAHQFLRAKIAASDSSKLYHPPAHEVNTQSIEFRERAQVVSSQTLSRSSFSGFSPLAFGCNKEDYGAHRYAKSNLGAVLQERNRMAIGLRSDKAVNPVGSQVLNVGVRAVPLAKRGNFSSVPLTINRDLHYSKPVALTGSCSNETFSATHLLRLANQAALSRGLLVSNSISNINQNYNAQTSRVPMLRGSFSNQEPIKSRWDAGYLHLDKNLGVSRKPHRPVPRLGILGPFLQKEIMANSSMNRTPLGINPVYSSELLPPQTNEMENAGGNCLFDHFQPGNIHPAVIKERNTKHAVTADYHSICRPSSSYYAYDGQVDARKMEKTIKSVQNSGITEKCIINRNPADFTLIDENNIYMRGN